MAKDRKDEDDKFLETVHKHYKLCVDADRENREQARKALAFRNLEQWDQATKNERLNDTEGPRPCLVVDKLNQHVQQVVNDQRQNRPQIKVRPVDDKADPETAKIYDGLIRHIQDASQADIAFDTGFEQAVDGGFGYWRILSEYCDPMSFEQDLRIKRIRNRFAVYLDPERQQPDGSDAQYGFILYKISKEKFKDKYGKSATESLQDFEFSGNEFADWYGDDWVLIAEYYWCEKKQAKIVLQQDGKVLLKDDYEKLPEPKIPLHEGVERSTEIPKIRWRTLTANKILDTTEWPGYCLPIVEVIGNELDIEGKCHRSGMIRPAMDAQRLDNYATSAFVEQVALAPRSSYVAEEGQIAGHAAEWKSANRRNISVLLYKKVDINGNPLPPPERQAPPGIPMGWQAILMQSEHNIQASMGRYDASLGEESNEKSGKAILARQRKGDVGSFHFSDNHARSMRHTGRILLDVIPKFYDTKRIARIIGEDGTPDSVTLDPNLCGQDGQPCAYMEQQGPDGKMQKTYNLGVGKYDVTIVIGPAYTTRRMEAADAMMEISRGNTEFLANFGDIIFKSQDWPGADQIAARFKKMNPIAAQEEQDKDVPHNPQDVAAIAALQQQVAQFAEAVPKLEQEAAKVKDEAAKVDKTKQEATALLDRVENEQKLVALQKSNAMLEVQNREMKAELAARDSITVEQGENAQKENVLIQQLAVIAQSLAGVGEAIQLQAQAIAEMSKEEPKETVIVSDANGIPIKAISRPLNGGMTGVN